MSNTLLRYTNMIKRIATGVLFFMITFITVVLFFRYAERRNYEKRGYTLIRDIESYKSKYNKLPETVKDLNLKQPEGEGPYYEKKDSLNYIIFFNIGFDNTKTYYSKTKEWKDEP